MAMTTTPYAARPRQRKATRVRDRIVYTTRFNEYHCEEDACIAVHDAVTGEPVLEHPCLGMIAIAALDVSRFASPAVASATQARPGQFLRFTPPTLDGPDVVTTELDGIEYRLQESSPAPADGSDCGTAILSTTSSLDGARVVYVDHPLARMNGCSLDRLRTDPALLLAGATPRPAYVRAIAAALRARAGLPFLAFQRKTRPDGTYLDVRVRIEIDAGADGTTRLLLVERG